MIGRENRSDCRVTTSYFAEVTTNYTYPEHTPESLKSGICYCFSNLLWY